MIIDDEGGWLYRYLRPMRPIVVCETCSIQRAFEGETCASQRACEIETECENVCLVCERRNNFVKTVAASMGGTERTKKCATMSPFPD